MKDAMLSLLLLSCSSVLVTANSRGIGVPCDVDVAVGSDDVNKEDESIQMWWALKATWGVSLDKTRYTLKTGDSVRGEPETTSYIPGQWTEIYIRSHEKYKQFTGLVMYAENSKGEKVGSWAIPPKAPFHVPGECVTHSNANQKRYLETFRFTAPKGTGTVTIKALLKYGLANPNKDGFFAWPNNKHLQLTEGTAPAATTWLEGSSGESCDSVCKGGGGTCDIETMKSKGSSSTALYQAVKATSTCTLPLMAGCSGSSPAVSDDGCFFYDSTCEPPAQAPTPNKKCTKGCGEMYPVQPGQCCTFSQNYYPPELRGKCRCLVAADQGQSYSEFNGNWEKGQEPDDTESPTPAPPKKEELECSAKLTWNPNARRLCACSGIKVPPTVTNPPGLVDRDNDNDGKTNAPASKCTAKMEPYTDQWCETNCNLDPSNCPEDGCKCASGAGVSGEKVGNSAPRYGGSPVLLAIALAIASALGAGSARSGSSTSNRMGVFLFIAMTFLPSTRAHNWLTSPARGNEAGENNGFNGFTSPPAPQKSARIHVQVGAGQKFPIEWAAGHGFGSFTYFAVLKGSDEAQMEKHTIELFDDYLANAPESAKGYLSEYPVHHVSHTAQTHGLLEPTNVAADYVWIPSMPSTKGVRPAGFRNFGDNPPVYKKTAAGRAQDVRAKYKSAKYPWLISVSKFLMRYDFPKDSDTSMIEIPKENGPGTYVVQYLWSGYYDAIDVNVLDVDSTDIFGSGGGQTGYDRVDHCSFINDYQGFAITTCKGISKTDTVDACSRECGNGCDGIQVIQTKLDTRVTAAGVWSGTSHIPPECNEHKESDLICYGLTQGTPKVGPTYRISADPEDPVFYNSCFKKSAGWTFTQQCNSCPPVAIEPGWTFGKECITCSDMRTNAQAGGYIPSWVFTEDNCRHCSNEG